MDYRRVIIEQGTAILSLPITVSVLELARQEGTLAELEPALAEKLNEIYHLAHTMNEAQKMYGMLSAAYISANVGPGQETTRLYYDRALTARTTLHGILMNLEIPESP